MVDPVLSASTYIKFSWQLVEREAILPNVTQLLIDRLGFETSQSNSKVKTFNPYAILEIDSCVAQIA